jgi:hypothetical protein
MEYFQLNVSQLSAYTFKRSDFVDRGVWITLVSYCALQENSGIIAGAEGWSEFECLQVLGITRASLDGTHALWHFANGNLFVNEYPTASQERLDHNRKVNSLQGKISALSKQKAALEHSVRTSSDQRATEELTRVERALHDLRNDHHALVSTGVQPRKGKVRKGKERIGNTLSAGEAKPSSVEEVATYASELSDSSASSEAQPFFDHYQGNGWRVGRNPMRDWRATFRNWLRSPYRSPGKNADDSADRTADPLIFRS